MTWTYILRECFVSSSMHLLLMASGMALAFPSILAPALSGDHSEMKVTQDELYNILSIYGLTGCIGYIFFPWIMQKFGRKVVIIIFSFCLISGSIIIAVAHNAIVLIIGRAVHGLSTCCYLISCTIAAEYTHPKRRGFHIVFKGASGGIGELLCHVLGLKVMNYRQTILVTLAPAILCILITLNFPESPQYLAYKGRYEECTAAFTWLRGNDNEAKKELHELILSQKEQKKLSSGDMIVRTREVMRSRGFWKLMFVLFWSGVACQFSGFMFIISYVSELVTMITGDRNQALYYTLALDALRILSIFVSSIIVKLSKRRTVLFSSGLIGCILMAAIAVTNYLKKDLTAETWIIPLSAALFVIYYVIVNVAIAPVLIVLQGELMPIKYKGVGSFVNGLIMSCLAFTVTTGNWKLLPILDIQGVFGVYFIFSVISFAILYFCLPETKDRTLQDIETEFGVRNVIKYAEVDQKLIGIPT